MSDQRSVYFIQSGGAGGPIKIGVANCPKSRLRELQQGNPKRLELIGTTPGSVLTERSYHELHGHIRIRGEWFAAERELLESIALGCTDSRVDLNIEHPDYR